MVTLGRLYAGTTMRVGLSAQSYPFPAPTGIADVKFRRPGDHIVVSFGVTVGPYDAVQTDTEVSGPIVPGKLGFVATGSTVNSRFDSQGTYYNYVFGGLLNWTPSDRVDVIAFIQGHMGGRPTRAIDLDVGRVLTAEIRSVGFFRSELDQPQR